MGGGGRGFLKIFYIQEKKKNFFFFLFVFFGGGGGEGGGGKGFFNKRPPPPPRQARTAFLIYMYISIIISPFLKNNFQSPMDFVSLTTGGFFVHQIYYQGFPDLLGFQQMLNIF